ncbi:MAG: chemotaxis protein CheW [Panacagrimonas sp.]
MSGPAETLQVALIGIEGDTLLLPGAAIAEVAGLDRFSRASEGPDWLAGWLTSDALRIPVLSFEGLNGRPRPEPGRRARIVVLHPLADGAPSSGYALLVQGQPQLRTLARQAIAPVHADPVPDEGLVLARARLGDLIVSIPDLAQVERRLAEAG